VKLARWLPLLLVALLLAACGSTSHHLYYIVTTGSSKLCAQGRVRGRMYHVLGFKQGQFTFSNGVPSPVPSEFLRGPCPAHHLSP
jgi:hypothetical protein